MLTSIPAAKRKAIYDTLAALVAVVTTVVQTLIGLNVLQAPVGLQVVQVAAAVLSVAGFVLARQNVTPDAPESGVTSAE